MIVEAMQEQSTESSDFHRQQDSQGLKKPEKERKVRRRRKKIAVGEIQAKKRQLTEDQANALELSFTRDRRLDTARKHRLAAELGLEPQQVAVWFQNRRVRWRCKQTEEEYASISASFDAVVLENCRLECQVLELQAKLEEAKKEIAMLALRYRNVAAEASSGSPNCSSSSTFISRDVVNQPVYQPPLAGSVDEELIYYGGCSFDNNLWDGIF